MDILLDSIMEITAQNLTASYLLLFAFALLLMSFVLLGSQVKRFKKKKNFSIKRGSNKRVDNGSYGGLSSDASSTKPESKLYRPNEYSALDDAPPYEKRMRLLTPREMSFYMLLKDVCSERGLYAFSKVRIADLIRIPDEVRVKHGDDVFWHYFSPIAKKHVDFVVCDALSRIVCVIEVDDPSHESVSGSESDEVKNIAFRASKILLFRFKKGFSRDSIGKAIDTAIERQNE